MSPGQQHALKAHGRLSYDSFHASWVPLFYGFHIEYDLQETQWNHLKQKRTPGRWI